MNMVVLSGFANCEGNFYNRENNKYEKNGGNIYKGNIKGFSKCGKISQLNGTRTETPIKISP
jgi:hypothetical protein